MMQMYRITESNIHQNRDYYCNGEYKLPCPCSKDSIKNHVPSLRFYYNSAGQFGGSIFSFNCSIKAIGTIMFIENSAGNAGGAFYLRNTSFCFIGSLCLTYYAHHDNSLQFSSHILFLENSATQVGGALYVNDANYTFYGNISFVKNSAIYGGALYIRNSSISLNADRRFSINFTAVYMMFTDNLAQYKGGAIFLTVSANMQMYGNVSLIRNNAAIEGGGSIFLRHSTLQMCGSISLVENNTPAKMCGTVTFKQNNASNGGAVHTEESNISMGVNCTNIDALFTMVVFQLNTATYSGGSISSIDSRLYFMGSAQFDGNMARYGGAVILDGTSNLTLKPNLSLSFINNKANDKGGVFYYDHSVFSCDRFKQYYNQCPECFVSLEDVTPEFNNNSASKSGSLLHSGKLSICYRYTGKISVLEGCENNFKSRQNFCSELQLTFLKNNNNNSTNETKNLFSADTEYVKFCSSDSNTQMNVSLFPGQKFKVSLTSMGTFNLPASTKILHKMLLPTDESIELRRMQRHTKVNNSCISISYYLLVTRITNKPAAHIKLYHQNPCDSLVDGVNLYIDIKHCPLSFQLSREHYKCTCNMWLQNFGVTDCNIDNLSVERKKNTFWLSKQDNNSGLIFHNNRCPFDFCKDEKLNVTLDNASAQCDFNRNGTLCGQCREQYSLALGTLHCLQCANSSYIALVIPFALAGIALVMVILFLHLTVDVGTLNGLIFYANIVSNRQAYFQHARDINNFHVIFISWLNLDFGIETCFYDGMDIYTYSWLQFLFPFYLWFLIGMVL